jgi:uncharacterized membrane protein
MNPADPVDSPGPNFAADSGAAPAGQSAPPKALFASDYVTTMSHFYRGEISRIMAWRARLDATTTWAITTTTTIFTVAFSFRDVPHIIFFFNICIVSIMLWIEARRYRFYDAFRARVRMLEAHFLVPMVAQNTQMLHGEWEKLVCEDLLLPSFKISKLEAVGRRMKRNYIFIYLVILAAWVAKIFMHAQTPIQSASAFYRALAVHGLPSWSVAILFLVTFCSVMAITFYVARKTTGEVSEFGTHRSAWRI